MCRNSERNLDPRGRRGLKAGDVAVAGDVADFKDVADARDVARKDFWM